MKKRILITGSAGYLGTYLVRHLVETRRYNIFLLFEDLTSSDFSLPEADVVIHLAARPNSFKGDPTEIDNVNFQGTVNLLNHCSDEVHFIFLSSDYVFSGDSAQEHDEHDPTFPETRYGSSKARAEKYIVSKSPCSTIVRTSMLYGYDHPKRKNFFRFLEEKLSRNEPIELFTDVYSRPTHIHDISVAIQKIIEEEMLGIYHVSGGEYVSRYEVGRLLCDLRGYDASLITPIKKPPEVAIPNYLNMRPSSVFEKEITTSLKEGMSQL